LRCPGPHFHTCLRRAGLTPALLAIKLRAAVAPTVPGELLLQVALASALLAAIPVHALSGRSGDADIVHRIAGTIQPRSQYAAIGVDLGHGIGQLRGQLDAQAFLVARDHDRYCAELDGIELKLDGADSRRESLPRIRLEAYARQRLA
jgi:hypothetical protein